MSQIKAEEGELTWSWEPKEEVMDFEAMDFEATDYERPSPSGVEVCDEALVAARRRFNELLDEIRSSTVVDTMSNEEPGRTGTTKRKYTYRKKPDFGEIYKLHGKSLTFYSTYEPIKDLCRKWVCGNNDYIFEEDAPLSMQPVKAPPPSDDVDLLNLVTKEATSLPRPCSKIPELGLIPPLTYRPETDVDTSDPCAILQDHLMHWKNIKQNWRGHAALRARRYQKSIQMLELMNQLSDEPMKTSPKTPVTKKVANRFRRLFSNSAAQNDKKRRRRSENNWEPSEEESQPKRRRSRKSADSSLVGVDNEDVPSVDSTVLEQVQLGVGRVFEPPFEQLNETALLDLLTMFREQAGARQLIYSEVLAVLNEIAASKRSYRKFFGFYKSPFVLPFILFIQSAVKSEFSLNADVIKSAHAAYERVVTDFVLNFLDYCDKNQDDVYKKHFLTFVDNLYDFMWNPAFPAASFSIETIARLLIRIVSDLRKDVDVHIRSVCLECISLLLSKMMASEAKFLPIKAVEEGFDAIITKVSPNTSTEIAFTDKKNTALMILISCLSVKCTKSYCNIQDVANFYSAVWFCEAQVEAKRAEKQMSAKKKADMKRCMNSLTYALQKIRACAAPSVVQSTVFGLQDAEWIAAAFLSDRDFHTLFKNQFETVLNMYTCSETVSLRTKACRIISEVMELFPNLLTIPEVERAVKDGIVDSFPAVRNASLDLVGKFLLRSQSMDTFDSYFPCIAQTSRDNAFNVRKKAVGIISDICRSAPAFQGMPSLLVCALYALRDDESTVKMAAKRFLYAFFFTPEYVVDDSLRAVKFVETFSFCNDEGSGSILKEFLDDLAVDDTLADVAERVDGLLEAVVSNVVKLTYIKTRLELCTCDSSLFEKYSEAILQNVQLLPTLAECFPNTFLKYVDVLAPFLSVSAIDKTVLACLLSAFENSLSTLSELSVEVMQSMDRVLIPHLHTSDAEGNFPALQCYVALKSHGNLSAKLFKLFATFLREANMARLAFEFRSDKSKKIKSQHLNSPTLNTMLGLLGRISSYFDIDLHLLFDDTAGPRALYANIACEEDAISGAIRRDEGKPFFADARDLFEFFAFSRESPHSLAAFEALGYLTAPHPQLLMDDPLRKTYSTLLTSENVEDMPMKIQTLKNLNLFVDRQSERLEEAAADGSQSGGRNPVMRELLVTIQIYWEAVKNLIFSSDAALRLSAAKFATNVISRRLVVPHNSAPLLISMASDVVSQVRHSALACLKSIDHLLVQNEVLSGFRGSYRLQKLISRGSCVRGYSDRHKKVAILDSYYKLWRGENTVRRNITYKLVSLFNTAAVSSKTEENVSINELLYIADNFATFSYASMDEPLIVIRSINEVLRRNESLVLQEFEEILRTPEEEQQEHSHKSVYERFPEDRSIVMLRYISLVKMSLLKALKAYLIAKYSLKAKDIAEYSTITLPRSGNTLLPKTASNTKFYNIRYVEKFLEYEGTEQGWRIVAQHFAHEYVQAMKAAEEPL
ncbi:hypothetical protein QR680_006379 [Steinernema hermaphroditum]|uniref:Nipped-B protein n=1 Tax=Steinernema hermaphroditum TaxID=289476 RepID=A0AA39LXB2_9BILA|nr:hypothetical protein QR680_006379 [Steinernema hermaphroditum]